MIDKLQTLLHESDELIARMSKDEIDGDVDYNIMFTCLFLFDKWYYEVFPWAIFHRKSRYKLLANYLNVKGIKKATEGNVCTAFRRIMEKRGIEDIYSRPKQTSVAIQASQVKIGVTSPIQNPSPIVREQGTATAPVLVSTITPVRPVHPSVVQEAAVIPPVSVGSEYPPEWWASQRERLVAQKDGMYRGVSWSADDDVARGLLLEMLKTGFIDPEQYEASAVYLGKKMTMYRKMWELLEEKRLVLQHQ